MARFKAFNHLFLGAFLSITATVAGMGFYMQPIVGDLTRLGGYLENNYGWNRPQESFPERLFLLAESVDEYDRHFDVVVLGDSFSEDRAGNGWQNYLAAATGWSIITFNMNNVPLEEVLSSGGYRESPPSLFVYQSVERNVPKRHPTCAGNHSKSLSPARINLPPLTPPGVDPELRQRNRGPLLLHSPDPSPVFNYWRKTLSRRILGYDDTDVHRTQNLRPALFSHEEDENILLLTRDLLLKGVSHEEIETAKCSLLELQNRIRSGGQTEFAVIIFPDKSSVYSDYLTDEEYRNLSIATQVEQTEGLRIARVIDRFRAQVDSGAVDFYLPNDTHCGYNGYKIAADALLETLGLAGDGAGT